MKISDYFVHNSTFLNLEAQNQNVRSTTKTVLRISKEIFLEPSAFSDKQFCENCKACNLFAIRLRMLFSFLNDVYILLILEFKNSFGKYHSIFSKNP